MHCPCILGRGQDSTGSCAPDRGLSETWDFYPQSPTLSNIIVPILAREFMSIHSFDRTRSPFQVQITMTHQAGQVLSRGQATRITGSPL